MIKEDISRLTKGSEKKIKVICDFQVSEKCLITYDRTYSDVYKTRQRNAGQDKCIHCSRQIINDRFRQFGVKYRNLNRNFMENIDAPYKAYFLGWIASDGYLSKNGTVSLSLETKDRQILEMFKKYICLDLKISDYERQDGRKVSVLNICSIKVAKDIAKYLGISLGSKSYVLNFPEMIPDEYKYDFIRGYFDGDGSISLPNNPNKNSNYLYCEISGASQNILLDMMKFVGVSYSNYTLISKGKNPFYKVRCGVQDSLNFLNLIYYDRYTDLILDRKYQRFIEWKRILKS